MDCGDGPVLAHLYWGGSGPVCSEVWTENEGSVHPTPKDSRGAMNQK